MAGSSSPPRVLVQLHGGLGNQLFQTAAGIALTARLGGTLSFDLSRFRDKGLRAYALGALPIPATIHQGGPGQIARFSAKARKLFGGSGIKRPTGWLGRVYVEPHYHYDPAFAALEGDLLLAGFFQSPRYFAGFEPQVRAAFDATAAVSDQARRSATTLAGEESIALHVRRGDYASNARARAAHGMLEDDYYERALALVRRAVPYARLFIFSDDAAVAAEKACAWDGTATAGASALEDLWLMSRCRHHIIANSSFSWWSAWLGSYPAGLTVAPRHWLAREKLLTTYIGDLFPPGWVLV
jgi:Glycosyl transferase family 11